MIQVCEIDMSDPLNIIKLYEYDISNISREIVKDIERVGYSRLWIHQSTTKEVAKVFIDESQFRKKEKNPHSRYHILSYPINDKLITQLLRQIKIDNLLNI
jgi:hypothetical protein